MASAIMVPTNSSFPAEIDATALNKIQIHRSRKRKGSYTFNIQQFQIRVIPLISSRPFIGLAFFSSSSTNWCTVLSIPFFMETGFAPEVTLRRPNFIISLANTEAVVVPSPAESFVLLATF